MLFTRQYPSTQSWWNPSIQNLTFIHQTIPVNAKLVESIHPKLNVLRLVSGGHCTPLHNIRFIAVLNLTVMSAMQANYTVHILVDSFY